MKFKDGDKVIMVRLPSKCAVGQTPATCCNKFKGKIGTYSAKDSAKDSGRKGKIAVSDFEGTTPWCTSFPADCFIPANEAPLKKLSSKELSLNKVIDNEVQRLHNVS